MTISNYHQKQSALSDTEIQNRIEEKKQELLAIFDKSKLETTDNIVRLAVLGCADKRYIKGHKEIFENILNKPVEVTTFDITADHLLGEQNVIEHDCTLPLPAGPFDITYAHVVLRFVETEKQWNFIQNSYDVLKTGGLAIHLLDKDDYEIKTPLLPNGLFSVPIDKWKNKLTELGIEYSEIPVKFGIALIIFKKYSE